MHTNEEHLESMGCDCPKCQGYVIDNVDQEFINDEFVVTRVCSGCSFTWDDHYKLNHFTWSEK